jgi:hypothetical protein
LAASAGQEDINRFPELLFSNRFPELLESVLQVHERVLIAQKSGGAQKKINPALNNVADWMVFAALSAACSTGATLRFA